MQHRKTGLSEDGAVFFYALQRVFFQNAAAFCKGVKTIGINPSVYMK